MSDVVARLNACRERFELSYRDLATKTNFSFSYLNEVHKGEKTATLDVLHALAPVYRTTVEWLLNGDPKVQIWPSCLSDPLFAGVQNPSESSLRRVQAIITYLGIKYAGHLRREDLAEHLGVDVGLIDRIMAGEVKPTPYFNKAISELTGIPASWIELGDIDPQALGLTPEEIKEALLLRAKAKALGFPMQSLNALLDTLATSKGGV